MLNINFLPQKIITSLNFSLSRALLVFVFFKSIKTNIKEQNNAIGHHAIGEVRLTKNLLVVEFY